LNENWRNKPVATNVLAFPAGDMPGVDNYPLGDIVICAEIVKFEADAQSKPYIDRMAHLFIHGLLHLLGYDHQLPDQALDMEGLEEEALSRLGYAKPYELS
jgi:probable rRNA maturation factor